MKAHAGTTCHLLLVFQAICVTVAFGQTPEPLQPCPNEFETVPGGENGERLMRVGCVLGPAPPPGSEGVVTTIRVELETMYRTPNEPNPNDASTCPPGRRLRGLNQFEGQVRWLGEPVEYVDEASPPNANYIVAPLVCDAASAHARDWSPDALAAAFNGETPGDPNNVDGDADVSRIYFSGAAVVPCSVYAVDHCDASGGGCTGTPLLVKTAVLGDVWAPFSAVNVIDITKLVDKFRGHAFDPGPPPTGAPTEPRGANDANIQMIRGMKIGVTDIVNVIDGFRGLPYKEQGPCFSDGIDECGNPCDTTPGD